ncbi:MAG: cytochrome c [Gammaproteobacteria bacterium]|jgi:cytochrome c5|nr:cytochrome c [Gammaproteobacteria bacterium]
MNIPSLSRSALILLVAAGTAAAQADDLAAGKQVYEATCSHCHDTGKMGAPVLSEKSDWENIDSIQWAEIHTLHLEDGMLRDAAEDPEKGITGEQMEAATKYILSVLATE